MEKSPIDDLYGDLGQGLYDSAVCHDEDSVDIYSGLEDGPPTFRGTGKDGSSISPHRLKESMDLYEQLITEEQEKKESTYNELKIKFDVAQNRVQDLLAKLEQMERQNSSLSRENIQLKKNFSALIKTARMEIIRKDEEISKLSNRRSWGGSHQLRVERSQVCSRRSLNSNSGPTKESHDRKEDPALTEASHHQGESSLSRPPVYPGPSTNVTPAAFSVFPRCTRSDPEAPVYSQNKNSDGIGSSYHQHLQNQRHVQSHQISASKRRENMCSEAEVPASYNGFTADLEVHEETCGKQADGSEGYLVTLSEKPNDLSRGLERHSDENDYSGKHHSEVDKNQSQTERIEPLKMTCVSSQDQCQKEAPLALRRSGRSKSPSSQPQSVSTPKLDLRISRESCVERTDALAHGLKEGLLDNRGEVRHRGEQGGSGDRRGTHNSVSEVSCVTKSDRNVDKRGTKEHHRKEERRPQDVSSSERRRTRSDGSREHKNTRHSEGRNRPEGNSRGDGRSTGSEKSKHKQRSAKTSEHGVSKGAGDKLSNKCDKDSRNRSHADIRESRRDTSDKYGARCNVPTRRKDHKHGMDKRKGPGRTEEQSIPTISSCDPSRDGKNSLSHISQENSDSSSIKEKCVDVDYDKERRRADKGKLTTSLDRKSNDSFLAEENTRSVSPEKCRVNEDGLTSDTVEAERVATVQSPSALINNSDGPAMAEESTPKRKLTFMETLNLTLSPVKKQSQPATANEPTGIPARDTLEVASFEDEVSFELGEEFCVIDEIENSQLSVEAVDETPASTSGAVTQDAAASHAPSSLNIQPNESQDATPSSTEPSANVQNAEVKENDLDFPKRFDRGIHENLTTPLEEIAIDSEPQGKESVAIPDHSGESTTTICRRRKETSQCALNQTTVAEIHVSAEEPEAVVGPSVPSVEAVCKDLESPYSTHNLEDENIQISSKHCQADNQPDPKVSPSKQSDAFQEEVSTSVDTQAISKTSYDSDASVSLEVVSSTVGVDFKPQNQDSCADSQATICITEITKSLEKPASCSGSLEGPWAEVANISSSSTEKRTHQEQTSEPDSTENESQNSKPSSSTVVPHDEDSMMLTLSNIKVIPEAISPLTSPVRQTKKIQEQHLGKEQHVKSLSKDFSASTVASKEDAWKMDMNKENKRPSASITPVNVLKDQQEPLSFTATEEDLEEGEIVSESDEEGALVIQSPQNDKTKRELRGQSSPRSPALENQTAQTRATVTPKRCEQGRGAPSKDSPTLNKRRFKTVTAPSKANIASSADFMNMLSFIRSELRRKYMKLHKNVTKAAFCCIIDMSLASFTEFVDSTNFHRFCGQDNDIKPRLNKIINSVMNKVSNNGIVNRIFDQRADDLKQKLWNFVDCQFDFLFKELKAALKSVSEHSKNKSSLENKRSNPRERETPKSQTKEPLTVTQHRRIIKSKAELVNAVQENQQMPPHSSHVVPCRARGLGSSGKNIKATMEEVPQVPAEQRSGRVPASSSAEIHLPECSPAPDNAASVYTRLSHSGSMHDRSDFEILTEQQTSSLTFNLVTDSQMGEIFRCLLQGSDLLEANVGDHQSWALNTPKKEGSAGESLFGAVTPSKMMTPSKLITWSSVSPYKFISPNGKIQMPLNPALLDESCLLEVPSNPLPNQDSHAPAIGISQQSFSILAEDLAVSLTIPSPLKSDGHLSFLHPPVCGDTLSVPSSVITAHYSEDALLDGEDATEQDIHLSLDTDNSSCGSSTGGNWDNADPVTFQFKPNLPMQAEIMERSNDHFIVRIRHTSPGSCEEPPPVQNEGPSEAQTDLHEVAWTSLNKASPLEGLPLVTSNEMTEVQTSDKGAASSDETSPASLPKTTSNPAEMATTDGVTAATGKEGCASETKSPGEKISRKRRKHYSGPKEKRSRREKSQDGHQKQRHKKKSKSSKQRGERTPSKQVKKTGLPQLSPSSLSAKNVVRKKGEVVVTWTREEDRDILLELKTNGATQKTFAALSTKLRKSPAEIEDRFTQLMKLFKKTEKM
ncbi:CASP8-associated protein 2 [Brachyhypopomus gauderio]|uniref:CASP8-associated protein 2 n=1 Tax=Brachyhypopomus gauderio TaxID=698409 RepID=UPI004041B029